MIKMLYKLSPQSPQFSRSSSCTGSRLSSADVAAALSGCTNPIAVPLLLVKYPGWDEKEIELLEQVHKWVKETAADQGWRTTKGPQIWKRMAAGLLDEYLHKRCTRCNGIGHYYTRNSVLHDCEMCEGSGYWQPNNSERARALGVDESSFRSTWQLRWEKSMAELCRIELEAISQFSQKLK